MRRGNLLSPSFIRPVLQLFKRISASGCRRKRELTISKKIQKNEQTNERTNERASVRACERRHTNEPMFGRTHERTNKRTNRDVHPVMQTRTINASERPVSCQTDWGKQMKQERITCSPFPALHYIPLLVCFLSNPFRSLASSAESRFRVSQRRVGRGVRRWLFWSKEKEGKAGRKREARKRRGRRRVASRRRRRHRRRKA